VKDKTGGINGEVFIKGDTVEPENEIIVFEKQTMQVA